MKATPGKLTRTNPLVAKPLEIPMEGGSARIRVNDETRCLNVNSLVDQSGSNGTADPKPNSVELAELLAATGENSVDPETFAARLIDWIDEDSLQEPGGSEDGVYAMKPVPYRTGSQPLADITEMRAIAGVDRVAFTALRTFLCAHPDSSPSPINANMLTEADAPFIAAMLGGKVAVTSVRDAIEARPPEGYAEPGDFWRDDAFKGVEIGDSLRDRIKLSSRYLEVNATIEYYEASLDLRLIYEVDENGRARLLSRRLGRVE
jgi:general secretion pathway protein K